MEIERKFLVAEIPENLDRYPHNEIEQAYISTSPTIRIRKSDSDYILTVKGKGAVAREEFELSITEEQYKNLSEKVETRFVSKTRYIIPIDGGLNAELDIYHLYLDGLLTVEVEFPDMAECRSFVPPKWFGKDISDDKRYKNTALSLFGKPE